jgi:hypothetical protein
VAAGPAEAHSYPDPALSTVLDAVTPPLPSGVQVIVVPSVVDQLVLSNPTAAPLEVLALGGEPYLRVSRDGVLGNLASRDWYATQTPEGGPVPPSDAVSSTPRWARVSRGSTWSVFDARIRPTVEVAPAIRKAGQDRILTGWKVPLTYGGSTVVVTGHVAFRPVRGGLVVAVDHSPFSATPLQGELPGLFARAPEGTEVTGRDGHPFLRFTGTEVLANTASTSWREDRAARGEEVTGKGWVVASRGSTFSWLDARLRYPADEPPSGLDREQVVQRWRVPVLTDGRAGEIEGTVSWVPRAVGVAAIQSKADDRDFPWWVLGAPVVILIGLVALRRRPKRAEART